MTEDEKLELLENLKKQYKEFEEKDRELEIEFNNLLSRLGEIAETSREMRSDFNDKFEKLSNEFNDWEEQRKFLLMNDAMNLEDTLIADWFPSEYSSW